MFFSSSTFQEVGMFRFLLAFVKSLLVPFHDTPPTAEDIRAYDDNEDIFGYSNDPTPTERYEMAVEWRDSMVALPLWILLRWRLAVAWMPFCGAREQRLVGEWLSRKLFPTWSQMHPRKTAQGRKGVRV